MIKPSVSGTTHTLPFGQLSPLDFERLCLALLPREGFADPRHLGAAGGEQGRDIVAHRDGALWYVQCKRVEKCGPQVLLTEVKKIEELIAERPDLRPAGLLFMVSCDVSATAEDRAAEACKSLGLACDVWARTDLDWRVQEHPDLNERFFQLGVPSEPEDLFTVPFIRNPDFVGRQEDLERLHEALHDETPVGIRPAGLTGMGGIGKTQLAVEYAYRYQDSYPGGVLWINAAEPLARGFAALGRRLDRATVDRSQEEQIRTAASYLGKHPDALLVFDNLADPAALNRQVAGGLISANLPCRVLFSTRRRDLGRFTPVEVTVLPEDAALQLLLRHPERQAALDPDHVEHGQAGAVCRLLGRLPLALEVAGAFLGEWPEMPLVDFRARLREEGALATLDEEAEELPQASLPLIHDAAVAATLQTHWEALADKDACLLLRVAGQLPEAAQIPVARLGLLAGVPDDGRPGRPSRLARSLKRLERASLVEELQETQIRLHPLVREFAALQTPEEETPGFRARCAANLADAYDQFVILQDQCARRGVDALQGDLLAALDLLPAKLQDSIEDTRDRLQGILRLLQRESHNLRGWVPGQHPGFFAQQVHYRAHALNLTRLATGAAAHLKERAIPFLTQQWRAGSESLALERTLIGHEGPVGAVALMPDGRRAVSISKDRTLRVWDLDIGQELAALRGHEAWVRAVAVTPDGQRAVSVHADGTLKVWDLADSEALAGGEAVADLLDMGHEWPAVAVSRDGRRVVLASDDGTLKVWDLDTSEALATLPGHESRVRATALTPDGRRAVSAYDDRTLKVWDLVTGQALATLRGHESGVKAVAVTPDGRRAVSGDDEGLVRVWDISGSLDTGLESACAEGTGAELAVLQGHVERVDAVAVTPDGRWVVSASGDWTLKIWDLASDQALVSGEAVATLYGHEGWVYTMALTSDGRRAVSGAEDGTLRVWDLALSEALTSSQGMATWRGHGEWVSHVAVAPDGQSAASHSADGELKIWDLAIGEEVAALPGQPGHSVMGAVALTPDGWRAVESFDHRTLGVWDISALLDTSLDRVEELAVLRGHEGTVYSVAMTPDGRRAVSGDHEGMLKVWDLTTGQALATLRGHTGAVYAVAVTPDGRRAVSGSSEGTVRAWDLACAIGTGQELATLRGHEASVYAVAVTPDGRKAVSGSSDRTLRVCNLATGEELAVLRGHEDLVGAVAVTPDGRRAVSASYDRTLRVWDISASLDTSLESGHELAVIALDGALFALSGAPDGVTFVTGDQIGNVYCLRYVEPPVTC
jgi:WD40 repeat protein